MIFFEKVSLEQQQTTAFLLLQHTFKQSNLLFPFLWSSLSLSPYYVYIRYCALHS